MPSGQELGVGPGVGPGGGGGGGGGLAPQQEDEQQTTIGDAGDEAQPESHEEDFTEPLVQYLSKDDGPLMTPQLSAGANAGEATRSAKNMSNEAFNFVKTAV